jgi:hypothetical protein
VSRLIERDSAGRGSELARRLLRPRARRPARVAVCPNREALARRCEHPAAPRARCLACR